MSGALASGRDRGRRASAARGAGDRRQVARLAVDEGRGQPGERARLHLVRRQAPSGARRPPSCGARQSPSRAQQIAVERAAAADEQFLRRRRHGGEPRRRQVRAVSSASVAWTSWGGSLEPRRRRQGARRAMRIEQVATGALRRRQLRSRARPATSPAARASTLPLAAQAPSASNASAGERCAPEVHQHVGRPAVEADGRAVGVERRQVGDAAEVEHGHVASPAAEHARDERPAPAARPGRRQPRRGSESRRPHRCRTAPPAAPAR